MASLTFIRYFVPDSNEFAPGWYEENNDGSRGGAVDIRAFDDLTPYRMVIDGDTPENSLTKGSIGYKSGKDAELVRVDGTQNFIITAKDAGADGNDITVEFEIGNVSGAGVESVTVDDKAIKFLLNSEGAFFSDIRSAVNFGESAGAAAARELIEITIASGHFATLIVTPVKVTNLLGGSEGTASIGYEEEQPAEVTAVAGDQDLIITEKNVGLPEITVEFSGVLIIGSGVVSIEVSGRAVKFTLALNGATLAEIKSFLDDDGSEGAVAARALINIRIAEGKEDTRINSFIKATALSGGLDTDAFIGQGPGNDEFFIEADAASVIIDDLWDKSSIIFENTVRIVSIIEEEVNAPGQVGYFDGAENTPTIEPTSASVTNYVVTLSSGNTITIWDVKARTALNGGEQRYEFLHENDDASGFKTAQQFLDAYKDGFYPDLTQTEITGAAVAGVDPNSGYTISGELTVVDPDVPADQLPEIMFVGSSGRSLTGIYGTLTVTRVQSDLSKFTWSYVQDNDDPETIALRDGQRATERFTLTAGNSEEFVLEIMAVGRNDSPVANPDFDVGLTGAVGEAVSIDLSTIAIDPDGDALEITVQIFTPSNDSASDLTYNPIDRTITGIPTAIGTYRAQVTVYEGLRVIFTKNLSIEIAVQPITGDNAGSVTEDSNADTATGSLTLPSTLTITLVDNNDQASNSGVEGTYGTMTFDPDSNTWTYTLDNTDADTNALKDTPGTDVFTFTAIGTSFDVTITISGVNDVPVVESEIVGQTGRVGQAITAIDLSGLFTDVDAGDTFTLTVMVLSSDGSKSGLDTIGLEYDSDTKMITGTLLNSIVAGPYTIEVIATDGGGSGDASQPSTFDIVVAPDNAPVIGGAVDGTIAEDAAGPITGTLTITDADDDALPTVALSDGAGQYGTLTFVASADGGVWTYELNNANADVQALKGGTLEDNFTFTAEGADPITVTITISGVNDAPVVETEIVGQTGQVGQEIDAIDLSGLFTDVDAGDTFTLAVMVHDGSGRVGLDTLGLTYDPVANAITGTIRSDVSAGTFTIEVIATDGSGAASQPSTFDIVVAADNAPVIGGAMDGTIAEDAADPLTGMLTITDADNDALPMVVLTDGAGQYGTLTFVASADGGVWTYTLDNTNAAVQALKGDTLTEEFTFTAEGADPITVTITISGVNDAPVVESEIVGKSGRVGQEITAIDLNSLFTDVDTGDTFTLTVMVLSSDGNTRMALGTTLGLEYDSDTKMITGTLLDSIPTGPYTIEVIATDGSGAASQPSTFDIVVVADGAPVIGGAVDGMIAEDAADPITGTLTITDAEGDALPTVELTNGVGQYGTLTFVASEDGGVWTYTLDNTNAAVQALKGDTLEDNFTFTAEGAAPITVTITITGVNDAPAVATAIEPQSGVEGQEKVIDLSTLFTDVDEGDELTFTVTLDGGAALSTIGLTYNSDDNEITGTLTGTGTYVIKIVATDQSGATVEATFDLNIFIIQLNSLTYNPDETSITIDETMLKVTSGNESDPTLLVYTITTLPDAGMLLKSGTQLNNGDTFTQADINNGLITYVPSVSDPSTSQSNPLSFTISDGVATLEEQTLEITSREVFEDETPDQDNTIDRSGEAAPQKIEAGDGSDIITGGTSDDQIDGGAGDDEIKLTRTVGDVEEDAGADEVLYTFGYDGVGIDGGDEIVGFKRGQDKLTFVVDRNFNSLTEFLQSLNGADETDLTADDAFIVTMQWGTDEAGAFYFDGVSLHFKDASAFGGGRVSSPLVTVTFDERLGLEDLIEILGEAGNVANNFDGGLAAFKNLDEVLPRLFGEGSIGFKGVDPSGTNGASERASEEPQPPIYETLSEQHGDDLQPTSFELGGGETDII